MPLDNAAGLARCTDNDAICDCDLESIGHDRYLGSLPGVREADLDALAADHDGAARRDPPFHDLRLWQAGSRELTGTSPAKPRPVMFRDRTGNRADHGGASLGL
jgi:hypothetical protein